MFAGVRDQDDWLTRAITLAQLCWNEPNESNLASRRGPESMEDCTMNTDQSKDGVAQPAEEEIKKHGDQLKKQVQDAAGEQLQDKNDKKRKDEPED
jgi:hypothetical protein